MAEGFDGEESEGEAIRADSVGIRIWSGDDQGVARKLGIHRRMVRQALADPQRPERKLAEAERPVLRPLIPLVDTDRSYRGGARGKSLRAPHLPGQRIGSLRLGTPRLRRQSPNHPGGKLPPLARQRRTVKPFTPEQRPDLAQLAAAARFLEDSPLVRGAETAPHRTASSPPGSGNLPLPWIPSHCAGSRPQLRLSIALWSSPI